MWAHTQLYLDTWGGERNFNNLRKFYKTYASDFRGAAQLRARLMECCDADDVARVINR